MNLREIASLLGCPMTEDIALMGVTTDSRAVTPGSLFVALRGERFDGHDFIIEAQKKGAAAVLCERSLGVNLPELIVPDTVHALAAIAKAHRKKLKTQVIALTGSNGKTSVKEMIASILPEPSYATHGNLNNHIGVPLCVLQLEKQHRYAVFELGANHRGEILHTVEIVAPQVALINNIGPAHIGEFGSMEGIAKAKGEIYQGLPKDGVAVINDDDAYAHYWDDLLTNKRVLRFSTKHQADIYAQDITVTENGCACFSLVFPSETVRVTLRVSGAHNVSNATAAASCCYALGIAPHVIAEGLMHFSGVKGRLTLRPGKNQATVIDDTYNANLRSSLAAIEVLAQRKGQRIFIFGDMGELGAWSEEHHRDIGVAARQSGIDRLFTVGHFSALASQAFGASAVHYEDKKALIADVLKHLDAQTTVLVKGSRSSRMEEIVQELVVV